MDGGSRIDLGVEAAYDRWAATYDDYDNPVAFMSRAALSRGIGTVDGLTIVEFGCGTGLNLAFLRQSGADRLIGFDLSDGMLAAARARGFAELFRHDMTTRTLLPDGCADAALFALSLEHVADLKSPLREASRLLRGGGVIWIVEIHPFLSLGGAKAHFNDGGDEIHMPTFAHRFCDYLDSFHATGLSIERCVELRPADLTGALPPKTLKRGKETPLVVMFSLRRPDTTKAG